MDKLSVYAVQHDISWLTPDENFRRVSEMLEALRPQAGSLIVLAEMFATGFCTEAASVVGFADTISEYLSRTAREHNCHIAAGLARRTGDRCVNALQLYSGDGKLAGEYFKQKLFSFAGEDRDFHKGNGSGHGGSNCGHGSSYGSDINSESPCNSLWRLDNWNIAPFICYDLRFPELQRRCAKASQLMIFSANWPADRSKHWLALVRARAIENLCYVAAVNRCGSDPANKYSGQSMIINPQGEIIAEAGDTPQILHAELDIEELTNYRKSFPALDDM